MALSTHVPYSQMACFRADGRLGAWGDAGDVIFLPAGVVTLCRGVGGAQRRLCCSFDRDGFPALSDLINSGWSEHDWAASFNVQVPAIKRDLYRLINEVAESTPTSGSFVESIGKLLLIELTRYLQQSRQFQRPFNGKLAAWQLRRISDYVEGQVETLPTVDELANLCDLSPRHLGRAFKESTGQTLGNYVKESRLSKAKGLLRDTQLSQKEIAYRLGFSSPSSFCVAFGKAAGMTPKQFRQLERVIPRDSAGDDGNHREV
jgi:AraC family transcriptional regulator